MTHIYIFVDNTYQYLQYVIHPPVSELFRLKL
jgi:hypothetical protein